MSEAFRDASLPVARRVADLLDRMTLPEKLAQLTSVWLALPEEGSEFAPFQQAMPVSAERMAGVLDLGVGQICRPYGSRPISPQKGAAAFNRFQRRLVEGTRLGIPALAHEETLCGVTTAGATEFPCPLNWGASFDPALVRDMADRIRRQARALGIRQGLAPVADVIRDQRWGRVEECVSEDPLLVGVMVTAYVQGLQGDDWQTGVVATLKHFAGYSGSDGGRNFAPLQAGERQIRETYLPPFERAIREGRAASVMNAYHDIDGQPCASSRWLLTDILRGELGFDGFVVADYFAVMMLASLHGTAGDLGTAAGQALTAGLDVELPSPHAYPDAAALVADGRLDSANVDASVRRLLEWKFRTGLFETPYAPDGPIVLERPDDIAAARVLAEKSIVLLKNDGMLPLNPATTGTVCVIGPLADDPEASFGNYHYTAHVQAHFPEDHLVPRASPSLLDALRAAMPAATVTYAQGCPLQRDLHPQTAMTQTSDGQLVVTSENVVDDESGIALAVASARSADVVVLALGDKAGHFRTGTIGEGSDASDIGLPGAQAALARAVLELGKPTVIALQHGRAFALGAVAERANAVITSWFAGQAGTAALADAIVGRVNPGGKSPVTFAAARGQEPRYYNARRLDAGIPRARDYEPTFAFGHGLSYTSFALRDVRASAARVVIGESFAIELVVHNTGERDGDAVVQIYAQDPVAETPRPVAELKGFARVAVPAGGRVSVAFTLTSDLFSYIGTDKKRIVDGGVINLWVGQSSDDREHRLQVELIGERTVLGADRQWSATLS
jgi:beta-glucosidase-like glycosyl hydrolase